MKEIEYIYAVSFVRTLENKMLEKSDFEAILNLSSVEETMQYLFNKGYGSSIHSNTEQNINAETLLKEELAYTWKEVKGACPRGAPLDILLYQNDFHNLKAILKAVFSDKPYEHLVLEPFTIPPEVIHRAIANGDPEILPDILRKPGSEAYQILARDKDGQLAEIVLDKALFNAMNAIARQSENKFLIGLVDLNITITDMKIALRGAHSGKNKAFLLSAMMGKRINVDHLADAAAQDVSTVIQVFAQNGFEEAARAAQESLSVFEKWCDNELIRYLRTVRYKSFGVEPIISFLLIKQFELKALRIVLSGIKRRVPARILRERLRDLYV